MTGNRSEQARAAFLALIMVTSMMMAGVSFSGSTAAQQAGDPITLYDDSGSEVDTYSDLDAAVNDADANETISLSAGNYDLTSDISFKGLTIEGPNAGTSGASEARGGEANVTFSADINADNVTIDGILYEESSSRVQINGANVRISNTVVEVPDGTAPVRLHADDTVITNNEFDGPGGNWIINSRQDETQLLDDVTVTDNVFQNAGDGVVQANGWINAEISGNNFTNLDADAVRLAYNVTGTDISNNIIRNTGENPDNALTTGIFLNNVEGEVMISGNEFENNPYHIASFGNSDEPVLENNEFDKRVDVTEVSPGDSYIAGEIQAAVENAAEDSTVSVGPGTYNEGVSIGTPNVTLEGPNAGTPGYGERSTEAVITQGVEISANEVSLDGFQITNNGGNGVRVADAPSNVTITNNRIANIAGGTAGNQKAFANGINLQFNNAFEKTSTGIEITNNEITNITTEDMDAYSNDAIGIQLLPRGNDVEDLRIEDNVISDIDPGDASNNGRAEARGISIDTQFLNTSKKNTRGDFGQATNLTIENNEIRNLSSEFSRAINLFEDKSGDTNTDDAIGPVNFTIAGNTVENVTSTFSDKPAEALFIGGYENLGEDQSVRNNNFLAVVENFEEDSQDGDTLNATSNWWGATNGPGGDFNGNGSAVIGSVSVDPAAVSLDDGSVNLTQDFVGVVKDSQNVTLNDTSDATFSFDSESVPGGVDGTLVLGINGTDYVFENVLDDGAINTSASGAEVDSGKNGTSIANTTPTGDTTITVVGNNSTTAVEDAGSVTLVHEAVGLSEGYNLKSVPQPAKLYTQDVDATNQWDPSDDTYESLSISQGGDVDSGTDLHRGLYVDAASNDARLGYSFATSEVPRPADVVMGNGWHLVGSNFDINSESGTRELDVDLRNVENVTTDGSPGVTAYDSGLSGDIAGSSDINEYDTYWVYVDGEQTRVIVAPNYDPNGR